MVQDYSQVNFRIPTKLKEQIEQASITNNRSITAELVSRLEQSFVRDLNKDAAYDLAHRVDVFEELTVKLNQTIELLNKQLESKK